MRLPPERGLLVLMVVAAAVGAALTLGLLALIVTLFFVEDGWSVAVMLLLVLTIGAASGRRLRLRSRKARHPLPRDTERVRRALERLAVMADRPVPDVEIVRARPPLSWTTVTLRGRPTVHVTTALLDRVGDRELRAVLAHELGHVLHRDALLMTVLAGPSTWAAQAARKLVDDDPFRGVCAVVCFVLPLAPVLLVSALLARLVSRYRELAADRAAVVLTGSAAAVAAALVAVDDELRRMPKRDLRRAGTLDCFNFVPARPAPWWLRFWATHPTVGRRLERLDRFERALQGR